jgi:hypothetical protein
MQDPEGIVICHKGYETITVPSYQLQEHIDHGDSLGQCIDKEGTSAVTAQPNAQSNFSASFELNSTGMFVLILVIATLIPVMTWIKKVR